MIKLSKFNYKFESVLILLIPIALIFSRFFLELFLLYISISFVVLSLKEKNFLFFKNKLSYLFLVLFSLIVTSYLFSDYKKETFTAILYFRFYFYIMALSYFFYKEKNLIDYFLKIIIFLILMLFFDSCIQYFTGQNIIGYKNSEAHRITSFFDDEQILGSFMYKIFIILIFAKLTIDQNKMKMHIFLNIALMAVPICIILSGERSALLLFTIMLVYFLIFFFREKKLRLFYYFSFFSIVILTIFLANSKIYYDRYITQTINSIFNINYTQNRDLIPNDKKNKYDFYFLSAQHQNYLETSLKIFNQNKIIGAGPKSYRYVCAKKNVSMNEYSCGNHPHNYYLQFISEIGLIGFIFIVSLYVYIIIKSLVNLYNLIIKKKYDMLEILILGYYFSQLWPITQTGNFFNNYNSIIFFLPLSIYISILFKKNF